jgi:hypothetical protein
MQELVLHGNKVVPFLDEIIQHIRNKGIEELGLFRIGSNREQTLKLITSIITSKLIIIIR